MRTISEISSFRRLSRPLAAATIVAVTASLAVGIGASSASAATATNPSIAVSNNQSGATNVTYTESFTTATTGVMRYVTLNNLPVSTMSFAIGNVYGIGAGTATANGTNSLTYTVTSPVSIAAGTPIYIEFTGFTNQSTNATTTSMSSATFIADGSTVIDNVPIPQVTIGAANTAVAVQIAKSLTFTNDTPTYSLFMDPSLAALSDVSKTVNLSIKTNARQGYVLSAQDTGMKNAGTGASQYTIPTSASVASSAFAANTFGVNATLATPLNSAAALGTGFSAATFAPYSATGTALITATKPTGNTADAIVLINRVKIDFTTPAGSYSDTIIYTATPTY